MQNCACFKIPNLVNTKVAKIIKYQPHNGTYHLFSAKSFKIEKGASHVKLF